MAMQTKMTFPTDDDDDLDVEALRMAALQTLKKSSVPPVHTQSTLVNVNHVNNTNNVLGGPRALQQNRGRGRGVMGGMRRGMHRGRGGYPQNFFPNRPSGNSNLITIVPTVPEDDVPLKGSQQLGSQLAVSSSGNTHADSTEQEKVPAKFRRLDDDSESEESDDDPGVKAGSDAESSGDEEDEKENDVKSSKSDTDSERDDLVTLQNEEEEDEDDNSLERLMRELEEEISETPKEKKPVASSSAKEKLKTDKVPRLKKSKKDKRKRDKTPKESTVLDVGSQSVTSSDKPDGTTIKFDEPKSIAISPRRTSTPACAQISNTQSRSPRKFQPVAGSSSPGRSRSPRVASPVNSSTLPRSPSPRSARSPQRLRSPRSRSPRRSRTPLNSRSPLRARSPLRSRSPLTSRSPRRSPPRSHYSAATRPGSRSPYRSPRRSPHYLPPRAASPSRLPPLRSRSRSPRSRSPVRVGYVRRSRSRTPLGALRPSPGRRASPYRGSRSRSRSPGGRLYSARRSRSLSPRGPLLAPRRSPSPRGRRSPLYMKKLSPKRRSISPRRRSISPRRRTPSPRRRSVSPRRRSVSPRRRPASPVWNSRLSPRRSRSPMGSFRPLSPRRRSPYADSYPIRRSPSPPARKYSPPVNHRGGSPARNYRSPSPMSRTAVVRRRSPAPTGGPARRTPPHHRAASPSYRRSPPKQSHVVGSPSRVREKPRQLSPLPPASRNSQRLPSPRRQRSPAPYSRGHHSTKTLSPARKVSPISHSLKRPLSPSRESGAPASGRDPSPNDSISLSPSPERQPASKGLNRGRKSHPLGESHSESKKSRTDLRSVLPRRRDVPKDDNVMARADEPSKRDKKKEKREKKRERDSKKRGGQETSHVLEARRRKFESSGPVEISGKKIRLRNMTSEGVQLEEQEVATKDVELNIEKEKERELKEVNEVDESILDRELMGGVDLLWSDEEEEEEEEEVEVEVEVPPVTSNVQFKRTFNLPSGSSGKENIPDDNNDAKKDEEEEPTSTTGSPLGNGLRDDESDQEECDAVSEKSGDFDDCHEDKESQDTWPKTNRELKEFIISQAKGTSALVRFPKQVVRESHDKRKSNESDVDLRAELSRRRAERLTKVNSCVEILPGRLLQSALQGVGVKSRREKGHRRRARSPPSFEDDTDQQESDGRRVLVLRRASEQKEPAINITISKVDSSKESNTLKISGKLPIHMRLGTGKKGDDSPKKVNLKRNVTVGRQKQGCYKPNEQGIDYFDKNLTEGKLATESNIL